MSIPFAYLSIVLIWSTTPLAIKWSAIGGGFAFSAMARMALGLVVVSGLILLFRIRLPRHRRAMESYFAGGLGLFGTLIAVYWGAQYVSSGLISVLFGLSPLVTSLFAAFLLDEPALKPVKLLGIVLGVAGLLVIFPLGNLGGNASFLSGLLAVLLAVLIQAASLVWMKRIGDDSPPLATTAGSLAVALPFFVLAWLIMADGRIPHAMPLQVSASIVYLAIFGSVAGFALYYYVIKHSQAGQVALITLVTPVLALLLGHVLNSETITWQIWLGTALISLGLVMHQWQAFMPRFAFQGRAG
ncbi:MAG: DMT family transporter [Sulfurimicrobium sp.]|nr:DMT family transporter [Sulfurimicrobium sp.]